MKDDDTARRRCRRALLLPAFGAAVIAPLSWQAWRVAEWRARSFARFFGAASTYEMIFFGTVGIFVLILLIAGPCLWLFRSLRLPTFVQVVAGLAVAALAGHILIHLDPGYPRPFFRYAGYEGMLTGFSCAAVFWALRVQLLASKRRGGATTTEG